MQTINGGGNDGDCDGLCAPRTAAVAVRWRRGERGVSPAANETLRICTALECLEVEVEVEVELEVEVEVEVEVGEEVKVDVDVGATLICKQ